MRVLYIMYINSINQIQIAALFGYGTVVFNIITGLLYTPWMINVIGDSDYALYTLSLSIVNFFLFDFGIGITARRFIAKYNAQGDDERVKLLVWMISKIYILISCAVFIFFVILYVNIENIYFNLSYEQTNKLKMIFVITGFYSIIGLNSGLFDAILCAKEKLVELNCLIFFQKVITIIGIVIVLSIGNGVIELVSVNAIVTVIFSVIKFKFATKAIITYVKHNNLNPIKFAALFKFSAWATVISLCSRFVFLIVPSVLALISDTWEIAIFGVAASLEGYVYTISSVINNLFYSRVSAILFNKENKINIEDIFFKVGKLQLVIIGFVVLAFYWFGDKFIKCWIGGEYQNVYYCVVLLIAPAIFELPQFLGWIALEILGKINIKAKTYCCISLISFILTVVLGNYYGAVGACTAICISYIFRCCVANFVFWKILNINIIKFYKLVYLKWFKVLICFMLVNYGILQCNFLSGWMDLIFCVTISFLFYIALCFFFNLSGVLFELKNCITQCASSEPNT